MKILQRNQDDVLYDLTKCQYQQRCVVYQRYRNDCPNEEYNCMIAEEERKDHIKEFDKKIKENDDRLVDLLKENKK